MKKTETIAEFLARGGKITIVPADQLPIKTDSIKSITSGGPAIIMSMTEADLYYGEFKARKAKKVASTIDLSALPEALRKKYVDEVINASKEEEDEEDDDS